MGVCVSNKTLTFFYFSELTESDRWRERRGGER